MRIYTNKSLLFINGDEKVRVKNFEMTNVPYWVKDTPLFELAKSDGTLTVIESQEQKVAAENGDLKKSSKNKSKETSEKDEKQETEKSK